MSFIFKTYLIYKNSTCYVCSNTFDATLCIAVFHHLASLDRRIGKRGFSILFSISVLLTDYFDAALLRELLRITKVGCEIMIQAWAFEQDDASRWNFQATSSCSSSCGSTQDVLVPWKLPPRFFLDKTSNHEEEQSQVNEMQVYQRYCHVFRKGELEDLASSCPGTKIVDCGWDRGNWFVRLHKTTHVEDLLVSAPSDDLETNTNLLRNAGLSPTGIMPRAATRL